MEEVKRDFVKQPTTKEFLLIIIAWGFATLIWVMLATNFFHQKIAFKENIIFLTMNGITTLTVVEVAINYIKNRITGNHKPQ